LSTERRYYVSAVGTALSDPSVCLSVPASLGAQQDGKMDEKLKSENMQKEQFSEWRVGVK